MREGPPPRPVDAPGPGSRTQDVDTRIASADDRLAALFASFSRLGRDDLGRVSLPLPDATRRGARDRAIAAAERVGLGEVLRTARHAAREGALGEVGAGTYRPTWMGLNWGISLGTAQDRAAIVEALDDVTVATVAHDLIEDDDREALTWAWERVDALATRTAAPESLDAAMARYGSGIGRVVLGTVVFLVLLPFLVGVLDQGVLGALIAVAVGVGVGLGFRPEPRTRR